MKFYAQECPHNTCMFTHHSVTHHSVIIYILCVCVCVCVCVCERERERQTDRQTERLTDRERKSKRVNITDWIIHLIEQAHTKFAVG